MLVHNSANFGCCKANRNEDKLVNVCQVTWVGDIIITCNVDSVHADLAPDEFGCCRAYKTEDKAMSVT